MGLDKILLNNGVKIPCVGFGVYKIENGIDAVNTIKTALDVGYRHIDTAMFYGNEESVGKAIKESCINRDEIFVCDKLWNSDQGYDSTLKAFETSLKKLDTEYIDLYLIHWPRPKSTKDWKELNKETWRAMEKLYNEGKIKAIGVSNFHKEHLEALIENSTVMPMVNQIECHPQLAQNDLVKFCQDNNIVVEAWGPLMRGKIFEFDLLNDLAKKYKKDTSQIVLRWHLQRGIIPLPKSSTPSRIKSNFEIFDFKLSDEDMTKISTLNKEERIGPHPDKIDF